MYTNIACYLKYMMNKVKNREMPTKTLLGGVWPVPKAWRRIDITMMMRTKEVIMSSSEGSSVMVVIKASNCKDKLYCVPLPEPVTLIMGKPCAHDSAGRLKSSPRPNAHQYLRFKSGLLGGWGVIPLAQCSELGGAHAHQNLAATHAKQSDFLSGSDTDRFKNLEFTHTALGALYIFHAAQHPQHGA